MLNALRLTEGFPLALFGERTGLPPAALESALARAEALYPLLLPYDGRLMVLGTGIQHIGPAAYYLGRLAATMGKQQVEA